jgi:hypothetical protein
VENSLWKKLWTCKRDYEKIYDDFVVINFIFHSHATVIVSDSK